ncbi:MAG TPA: NAD-dependent DNA ligase LigA [Patescibacteria group bacterium]|nr:NAD-dependent DNA ligase LigA [Patescibacteria group bacterium]
MTKDQAKERVKQLRKLINEYSYKYHVLDDPTVPDAVWDSLKHELAQLEEQYPDLVTPDSPTQRVGGKPLDKFVQIEHSKRMLSLNDVFNREEVEAWLKRMQKLAPQAKPEFFIDLKLDGLACALHYENGKFVRAITRGDGFVGEDVTNNVRTIASVPFELRRSKKLEKFLNGRTEIRGEIIIYKKDFETLNKQREAAGQPLYANPRNTAAGSIRQLDPKLAAARPLRFQAWDLLRNDSSEVPTNGFAYEALRELGIPVGNHTRLLKDVDEIMAYADQWEKKRHELPYLTDGLVIKLNDRRLYEELGVVGKAPRAAVAYKYAAEEATTKVKDIIISIGRTGAATPIAVFEPVVVAGTTVQHASLHNADEIERKDIRVEDTVVIYKAGDIIPQVERVLTELRPKTAKKFDMEHELKAQFPELEFVRPEGEAVYRVKGATSKLLLKQALIHFASKSALDIDTLGEKNVGALVDAGLVHDLSDIYKLTKKQILEVERFAEISANKLIEAIALKKNPELARFIYGLGIRHVGAQTAIDLANYFKRLDNLGTTKLDDLRSVEGIGEIVAESIMLWFDDDNNQKMLAKFRGLDVWPKEVKTIGGKLANKNFVVTGTLEGMSRDDAAEKIRKLGGTFQTSVGQDTDFLVVGQNVGESKLAKARQLGTKQITEKELLQLIK